MKKSILRASSALRAVALLGAGTTAAVIASAPAHAQDYTRGVITGQVVDDKGTPISGATVSVRSNEQGFVNNTTTNTNGQFTVPTLPTGTYTVIVQSNGRTLVEDRGVRVIAGQTATFAYTAAAAETAIGEGTNADQDGGEIVVTGRRVQVNDFATTQTGANLDVAQIASTVPIGRDQTSLILLAPGTTGGDTGFGNLASISGATVAENSYYVNGLNITDFRAFLGASLIPFEFYRTLDVKTGGYQAEFGRALGGVTSAVTKAGTNELQGGVVVAWSPDALRKDSPNTYLALNKDDERTSVDANFYLSGPVIKDRLFLYGLYSPRYFKNSDTSLSLRSRLTTTSDSPFWGLKADAVIVDGHRLEGTIFSDRQTQKTRYQQYLPAGSVANPTEDALGNQLGDVISKLGGINWIGTYTGRFTDFFTLTGSYGQNRDKGTQRSSSPISVLQSRLGGPVDADNRPTTYCDPIALGCANANASPYLVGGTVIGDLNDVDVRKVWRVDGDIYANFLGKHHIRAGYDNEDLRSSEGTSYNGGYYYDIRRNLTLRYFYENTGEYKTNMRAFYLQDAWQMFDERINLQLGVRNDRFRNYTEAGEKYYDSKSQWAPRIGATFDVFGDKRTKLNAFYGQYYLPIAANTNIRLAGSETYLRQRFAYPSATGRNDLDQNGIPDFLIIDPTTNAITNFVGNVGGDCPETSPLAGQLCDVVFADGELGPTDTLVAEGLQPSKSTEIILGGSHQFGGGWTVGVDYVRRRLNETLEDVAIDAAVLAYCDREGVVGCDDVFYGFHQYVLANPGSDITVRLDGDCTVDPRQCEVVTLTAEDLGYPRAKRNYNAVQFTVDKAFNGVWGFNGSYTWTRLRGNFEGGVKSDNNQTDTGLTQDFDQPGLTDNAEGILANERKHSFKLYGHVKPVSWLDIGANLLVESPRNFSCIGNHPTDAFASAYGAASFFCQQPEFGGSGTPTTVAGPDTSVGVARGRAFKSDWNKEVNLGLGFLLGDLIGSDALRGTQFRVDVFNLFNWKQKLDFNEFGDVTLGGTNPDYRLVNGYQTPRSVRFTLAMRFGQP